MLEKFKKALNKGGDYAALLTKPSKAYDCIPHNLIIAKLTIAQKKDLVTFSEEILN